MNCPHCGQPVTLALIGGTAATPPPAAVSGPRPGGTPGLGPLCPVHAEAFVHKTGTRQDGSTYDGFFCPVRGCRERPPR